MYLRFVLPEIEDGLYQDLNIEKLPIGLQNYYHDHWLQMGMTSRPLPERRIKIVYILSEIRQPVSRHLIAEYSEESELVVQEVLDDWSQFLHKQFIELQTCYSICHTSFQDFLNQKEIIQATGILMGRS